VIDGQVARHGLARGDVLDNDAPGHHSRARPHDQMFTNHRGRPYPRSVADNGPPSHNAVSGYDAVAADPRLMPNRCRYPDDTPVMHLREWCVMNGPHDYRIRKDLNAAAKAHAAGVMHGFNAITAVEIQNAVTAYYCAGVYVTALANVTVLLDDYPFVNPRPRTDSYVCSYQCSRMDCATHTDGSLEWDRGVATLPQHLIVDAVEGSPRLGCDDQSDVRRDLGGQLAGRDDA
jgi:hypothetical protein